MNGLFIVLGYSRKTQTRGLRIYFSETPPPRNFRFVTLPLEIPEKTSPWQFQGQKPKPIEIPNEFFL